MAVRADLAAERAPEERLERTAFLPGRGVALSGDLADFAGRKPTPLRLTEILAMKTPEGLQSILQEELPVRLANRIAHFDMLPDLQDMKDILSVRADFAASFEEVLQAKSEDFRDVIRRFKKRNEDHALRLTRGMQAWSELQQAKGEPYEDTRAFIDTFLNRLFLSRIGLHITWPRRYLALSKCPDGIVEVQCDPCKICASAAKQVTELAAR
ncbi:[Pyruvate dehydrogenase (acetyl-transferring)] kinase [Durusdinium trenchii]|uniref:Protein-serine/threonine kinase n=1 Tax=Durusdinium trenchii TaxID=1381693 RepID=A0ABP0JSN3_9DINO